MQIKRKTWIENIAGAKPEHQIYLDESGINTNLTRHYAHAVHGKRAIDAAPINTPAGTTVLSSIRLNDSLVYTTYQGGTTAQRFREYMKEQLIPSLEKDDVVIMDNMHSHHAKIVTELLDKSGISYLYLPPYSPDLNPIEKMWSKMKSILRKRKIRIASELPEAVKAALESVSTNDCRGWFRDVVFALIKRAAIVCILYCVYCTKDTSVSYYKRNEIFDTLSVWMMQK